MAAETEYGLTTDIAIDATVGYSMANYQGGPVESNTLTHEWR